MLKTILPCGIAAILLVILAYMFGTNNNKERIEQLIEEKTRLETQKEAVERKAEENSKIQEQLSTEVDTLSAQRDRLKNEVVELEKARLANQLSVRRLRNSDEQIKKLIDTYPQLNERNVFIFEHPINKEGTLKMDYAGIPSAFVETFIIEHDRADKYLKEKTVLDNAVKLGDEIIVLKDSIYVLEKEKFQIYKTAYEDAYNAYMKINGDFIEELKKSKFDFGHWGAIAGGAVAGYLMGKIK